MTPSHVTACRPEQRDDSTYAMVHYPGSVAPWTAPEHLALCSAWHGGPSPRRTSFRLLELGCGDGTNLLSLAFYNAGSTFVGIDSCRVTLQRARAAAREIGLENVEFELGDVRKVDATVHTPYDYVIAHGLYSWVPDLAREAILRLCYSVLAPSGLAYVSYNAQPGWANRGLVRQALLRSSEVRDAPLEHKAERARQVARRLLEDLPSREYAFAALLTEELERVRDGERFYVLHEYLAEFNEGFWLRDFVERSGLHGLAYVGDAQFSSWQGHVPAEVRETVNRRTPDCVERAEMIDLLCNRYFHASVMCRDDAPRETSDHEEFVEQMEIASCLRCESDLLDLSDGVVERFVGSGGIEVKLDAAITKAAVIRLAARWPVGEKFYTLFAAATAMVSTYSSPPSIDNRSRLLRELLTLLETGQLHLYACESTVLHHCSEHPLAHSLARFEAARGLALSTAHHMTIRLDPDVLALICMMDGTRSRTDLCVECGANFVDEQIAGLGRWGLLG